MEVEIEVKRSDLLKMQLILSPRLAQNYYCLGFIIICAAIGGVGGIEKVGVFNWATLSIKYGTVVFFIMMIVCSFIQIVSASPEKGFIGKTKYELDDSGFSEETLGTETKTRWKNILGIYKFKSYCFVRINGFRMHIIPKREFKTEKEFEDFYGQIIEYRNNA